MTLGQLLKSARARIGKTLRELEAATGISNGYLSQLESDRVRQPSPRHLHTLATALDLEYRVLMELSGYAASTESIGRRSTSRDLPGLEGLTEDDRRKVMAYIQDLRDARQARKRVG